MSKRKRQPEKWLNLNKYELKYEGYGQKNLFDDEYGDILRDERLMYDEISDIKIRTLYDCLKIGRNILDLLHNNATYAKLDEIIQRSGVHFGRTQAIKYIECYNYYNEKFQNQESTENLDEMGIEKVYLLSTIGDSYIRIKLEKFILDENLTVKQLTALVKIIKEQDETFKIATKFLNTLKEIPKDINNPF